MVNDPNMLLQGTLSGINHSIGCDPCLYKNVEQEHKEGGGVISCRKKQKQIT
jgi:hypothetical protein